MSYNFKGNYALALKNLLDGLSVFTEIKLNRGITQTLSNIGLYYSDLGDYPKSLDYYIKALTLYTQMGDKQGIATCYTSIGILYDEQQDYEKALEYDFKAVDMNKEMGDKTGSAIVLGNIGNIYHAQKKYAKALASDLKSLAMFEELGDIGSVARNLGNIGNIYADSGKYDTALAYAFKALAINRKIGNKTRVGFDLILRLALALDIRAKDIVQKTYGNLAEINTKLKNYKAAYDDERLCKLYHDTVFSSETEGKLASLQMQNNFDKKQDSIKTEQVKKDITAKKEIQNQKNIRNFFMAGLFLVLVFAGFIFRSLQISRRQKIIIEKEKQANDELLLNILPGEVADELKATGEAKAKSFETVTVMFTDFKDFTKISESLSPTELVTELHYLFQAFDNIIHNHGIEKIKTIGDSYMAAGGLPVPNQTNAKDVVSAALEIVKFMETHKRQRAKEGKPVFEIRIGINTGPVVAGIVGVKKFAYDIWGDTVNLASRMESSGEPGKVNISGSTYELVKNASPNDSSGRNFICTHRGKIQAKNKGEVDMYFVS